AVAVACGTRGEPRALRVVLDEALEHGGRGLLIAAREVLLRELHHRVRIGHCRVRRCRRDLRADSSARPRSRSRTLYGRALGGWWRLQAERLLELGSTR